MAIQDSTKPAFTPGPWRINPRISTLVEAGPDRSVATSGGYQTTAEPDGGYAENQANAHLIASAPALYEALKSLADLYAELRDAELIEDSDMTELKAARAALAQAEGRSS